MMARSTAESPEGMLARIYARLIENGKASADVEFVTYNDCLTKNIDSTSRFWCSMDEFIDVALRAAADHVPRRLGWPDDFHIVGKDWWIAYTRGTWTFNQVPKKPEQANASVLVDNLFADEN